MHAHRVLELPRLSRLRLQDRYLVCILAPLHLHVTTCDTNLTHLTAAVQ